MGGGEGQQIIKIIIQKRTRKKIILFEHKFLLAQKDFQSNIKKERRMRWSGWWVKFELENWKIPWPNIQYTTRSKKCCMHAKGLNESKKKHISSFLLN